MSDSTQVNMLWCLVITLAFIALLCIGSCAAKDDAREDEFRQQQSASCQKIYISCLETTSVSEGDCARTMGDCFEKVKVHKER